MSEELFDAPLPWSRRLLRRLVAHAGEKLAIVAGLSGEKVQQRALRHSGDVIPVELGVFGWLWAREHANNSDTEQSATQVSGTHRDEDRPGSSESGMSPNLPSRRRLKHDHFNAGVGLQTMAVRAFHLKLVGCRQGWREGLPFGVKNYFGQRDHLAARTTSHTPTHFLRLVHESHFLVNGHHPTTRMYAPSASIAVPRPPQYERSWGTRRFLQDTPSRAICASSCRMRQPLPNDCRLRPQHDPKHQRVRDQQNWHHQRRNEVSRAHHTRRVR